MSGLSIVERERNENPNPGRIKEDKAVRNP